MRYLVSTGDAGRVLLEGVSGITGSKRLCSCHRIPAPVAVQADIVIPGIIQCFVGRMTRGTGEIVRLVQGNGLCLVK